MNRVRAVAIGVALASAIAAVAAIDSDTRRRYDERPATMPRAVDWRHGWDRREYQPRPPRTSQDCDPSDLASMGSQVDSRYGWTVICYGRPIETKGRKDGPRGAAD